MIILSSFGFRSPIVAQKMNSYIFCPEDKKVLIIPFAGFNSEDTGVRELGGLVSFGFCSENIFILGPNNAEDAKKISFDYIYVPGGDTFKLLSELQKIDYLKEIVKMVKDGSSYIGVSAGAMIATTDIEYVAQIEDNNYSLKNYAALGLIDDRIICHIDQLDSSTIAVCIKTSKGRNVLGISNDEVKVISKPIETFSTFYENDGNCFAKKYCEMVAEFPTEIAINPLIVFGETCVGKTHLLNAIKYKLNTDKPNIIVKLVSMCDFVETLISEKHENFDVLLLDDCFYLIGRPATQMQLASFVQKLSVEGKQVVMACCCSKEDISLFVDCIISAVPSSVLCEIKNERVLSYE